MLKMYLFHNNWSLFTEESRKTTLSNTDNMYCIAALPSVAHNCHVRAFNFYGDVAYVFFFTQ